MIVEPVLGQIKGRAFWLLRGLENAFAEWTLIRSGHNLFEDYRVGWRPAQDSPLPNAARSAGGIATPE